MAGKSITFYVDVVSPFGYEAYYVLRNDPVFKSVQRTYIPIFLGGVMKATGNQPPINIKNKDKWIGNERTHWAKVFNVPMKAEQPKNFPPMTLYVMRVLAALTIVDSDNETLAKAVDALFQEFWTKHADISKPEVYQGILEKAIGVEKTKKAIELAPNEGKQLILSNSEAAVKDGAFGLPWSVCDNGSAKAGFWGVDHIEQLADFMGIERPKTQNAWKSTL